MRKGVKDYSDKATVAKGKRHFKVVRQEEIDDLKAMLDTPQGRRVIWRIMDHSQLLGDGLFTGDERTNYNIGRRDEGLWLYQEVMASSPEVFLEMMAGQIKDTNND